MTSFAEYKPQSAAALQALTPESAPASLSSPSGTRSAVRDAARGGRVLSLLNAAHSWLKDFAAGVRLTYAFLRACWLLPRADKKLHVLAVLETLRSWWKSHYELTIGDLCVGCDSVHAEGEGCDPKRMRFCLDCETWRPVTSLFRCPIDKKHSIHPRFRKPEVIAMK